MVLKGLRDSLSGIQIAGSVPGQDRKMRYFLELICASRATLRLPMLTWA